MHHDIPLPRQDLELIPFEDEGERWILVRDPLGLVPDGLTLPAPLLSFVALLDGSRDLAGLQRDITRSQGGEIATLEEVKYLLTQLDEAHLLDSPTFRAARDALVARFETQTVRPPALAGEAYPEDPAELERFLDDILTTQPPFETEDRIVALTAPHIDPGIGEKVYARAYRAILRERPDRVVVLGVGHQLDEGLFCLTDKDFATPLGLVPTDREAVRRLVEAGGPVVAESDFAHRREHSIEFQTLFLRHVLGAAPFLLTPILCGSPRLLPEYGRDCYLEQAGPFLDALRALVLDPGKRTLVVAGVDLSHIGPKFGHPTPAAQLERRASAHDRRLLESLTRLAPDDFWEESALEQDQYNVCGFSALACLLEILPPSRGLVLDYEVWREEATRSAVSFAAAVFTAGA